MNFFSSETASFLTMYFEFTSGDFVEVAFWYYVHWFSILGLCSLGWQMVGTYGLSAALGIHICLFL